jgi:hypothetical protein
VTDRIPCFVEQSFAAVLCDIDTPAGSGLELRTAHPDVVDAFPA